TRNNIGMGLAVRQRQHAGNVCRAEADRLAVRPDRYLGVRQMRQRDGRDRRALIDDMAVELLVDGAAEAVGARGESLDEAAGYPVNDTSHHDIYQVLDTTLRQHCDVLDYAEGLQAPPRFDFVLDVIEHRRALPVAARQQHHLVGLRRLVDVDEALHTDI